MHIVVLAEHGKTSSSLSLPISVLSHDSLSDLRQPVCAALCLWKHCREGFLRSVCVEHPGSISNVKGVCACV